MIDSNTYKIDGYNMVHNHHYIKDKHGNILFVDLFVSDSFLNSPIKDDMSVEEMIEASESLVGKKVYVKELIERPTIHIANNVRLL